MATKKFIELQEFSDVDLKAELDQAQKEYGKVKFDHAVSGIENPLMLRSLRRDVARIKTELRRRELSAMSEGELSKRTKIRRRR